MTDDEADALIWKGEWQSTMTVRQLRRYARHFDIDIAGLTRKADIIDVLMLAAGEPT